MDLARIIQDLRQKLLQEQQARAAKARAAKLARKTSPPPAVAAQTASSVVIRISRTASAMQNGMLDVKQEPGLQSVAKATVAPASSSRRACGYGCLQLNSTPGSRVATTGVDTRASTSSLRERGCCGLRPKT